MWTKALFAVCLPAALAAGFWICAAAQPTAPPPQKPHDHDKQEHRFRPEQFEQPERAKWQKPDEVVARLKLQPGQTVADIGAGSGYFTRRLAEAVGPTDTVYAVDIDENMLRYIQQNARILGLPNVVPVLAAEDDPALAPQSVDLVFICNTVHHFPDRPDYYRKLQRALRLPKPSGPATQQKPGRLAIVDFVKEQRPGAPPGPPMAMRIAKDDLIREIEAAGFRLVADESNLLPYQYFLIFEVDRTHVYAQELRRQVAHGISQGRSLQQIQRDIQIPSGFPELNNPRLTAAFLTDYYEDLTTSPPIKLAADAERRAAGDELGPRALALIADRFHEPEHIEVGLSKAFRAAGIDLTMTVDYRQLTDENLKKVDLFVILRDGMIWPDGHDKPYVMWMTPDQQQALADFVKRGGGFLALHNCTGLYPPDGPYYEVLAGQYHDHSPIEPFEVAVVASDHPVTRGVTKYRIHDEQHWPTYDEKRAMLLLRSRSPHGEYPAGWAYEYGQGRVCYLANGHTPEAIEHPMFQRLLRNAIHWCLRIEEQSQKTADEAKDATERE